MATSTRAPRLRAAWEVIRRTYRRVGQAEARAIMSAFYFIGLGPVALLMGRKRRRAMLALDLATEERDTGWLEMTERSRLGKTNSTQQY